MDNLDPNWDPNERLCVHVPLPPGVDGESGMPPERIKDEAIRAKYKAAVEENNKKNQIHSEQNKLRLWMERFPDGAGSYIIKAYSNPPYNVAELKESLSKHKIDEKTKSQILDAVMKNTGETQKK